jgi:uncharacterized protein YbbC (DUF1343 family)
MQTGLDRLIESGFRDIRGKAIAVICNQATIDANADHILDHLLPLHRTGALRIVCVFGPEHGLYGHTQDNMIEWEGEPDTRTGLVIHSLYGQHRKPTPSMLEGVELILADIPDIGSRYYTFIWTICHCMEAGAELGIPLHILDRPNPIGGTQVEGTVLEMAYSSFVGLYSVPTRHGMTAAEILKYVNARFLSGKAELTVTEVEGWDRTNYLDAYDRPWAMPSPNMPTIDTAVVYPGGCLLEATNLSEGRGTTRPFEIFGAPFLDGWNLAKDLNDLGLSGVKFRPIQFEPTFNKHAGRLCEGCFVHVTDRARFEPVLTYIAIMQACVRQTGLMDSNRVRREDTFVAASAETELKGFAWKQPPYEYVSDRMPIDILAGNGWLRDAIEQQVPLSELRDRMRAECDEFFRRIH